MMLHCLEDSGAASKQILQESEEAKSQSQVEPAGCQSVRADDGGVRPISIQIVFPFIRKSPHSDSPLSDCDDRYSSPHLTCFPVADISYQLSLLDTSCGCFLSFAPFKDNLLPAREYLSHVFILLMD